MQPNNPKGRKKMNVQPTIQPNFSSGYSRAKRGAAGFRKFYFPRENGSIKIYNITGRNGRITRFNYQEFNGKTIIEQVSYQRKDGFKIEELFAMIDKRFKESKDCIKEFISQF